MLLKDYPIADLGVQAYCRNVGLVGLNRDGQLTRLDRCPTKRQGKNAGGRVERDGFVFHAQSLGGFTAETGVERELHPLVTILIRNVDCQAGGRMSHL